MNSQARRALWSIRFFFYVMGTLSMAWVPRIPEVKHSLGVNNGQFGLILIASTCGAVIGAQVCGRVVHTYGSQNVLRFVGVIMPSGLILMSQSTHHVLPLVISLFFMGIGTVGIDICANVQAVAIEKITGKRYMSSFHGLWSVGTFVITLFGGVVAHYIAPSTNILIVGVVGLAINLWAIANALPSELDGHAGTEEAEASVPFFGKHVVILWMLGFGMIGALLPEASVSDWSPILLKENMGFGKGINASGFAVFALAMIVSRMYGDRILAKFGAIKTVKLGGYFGGLAMAIGVGLGVPLSHANKPLALIVIDLGFIIAGLGIGPMVPALMLAAANQNGIAPSVALARIGLIGMAAYFMGPTVTGGLAQAINLPVAMAFPIGTLLFAGWISREIK